MLKTNNSPKEVIMPNSVGRVDIKPSPELTETDLRLRSKFFNVVSLPSSEGRLPETYEFVISKVSSLVRRDIVVDIDVFKAVLPRFNVTGSKQL
jgi:hypothetical protein